MRYRQESGDWRHRSRQDHSASTPYIYRVSKKKKTVLRAHLLGSNGLKTNIFENKFPLSFNDRPPSR